VRGGECSDYADFTRCSAAAEAARLLVPSEFVPAENRGYCSICKRWSYPDVLDSDTFCGLA
jgi:hypothetical protein